MVKEICDSKKCTGCAACRDICPKQCISMCFDSLDALHPFIDETKCINCGLCFKTCPNNVELLYNRPEKFGLLGVKMKIFEELQLLAELHVNYIIIG